MKNQNASAEYPHIPAKGSLQTALPMAALRSLPLLQWRQGMEGPCVDGRSSFFQIAAFLLREGGGVSPSTLECRLIQPLALRRGVMPDGLDTFAQRSSYTLFDCVGCFSRSTRPRR